MIDHELDLTNSHARYNNDDEDAPAFDPAALIKIILLAYSLEINDLEALMNVAFEAKEWITAHALKR